MLVVCRVSRSRPHGPSEILVWRRANRATHPRPTPGDAEGLSAMRGLLFIRLFCTLFGPRRLTMSAFCPECEATLTLNNVVEGEIVVCPDCGVDLEVTALGPTPTLALAP